MTPTSNPFGSVTAGTAGKIDFSAKSGQNFNNNFYTKNKTNHTSKSNADEGMMDILNSAVGDFTERPLQIMIREIAKNFLIFTPIGWIILLYILGRKYKGNLHKAFKNINEALADVINSYSGKANETSLNGTPTKDASSDTKTAPANN